VLATEETRALGQPAIDTEELLLGLMGEPDGLASRALHSLGVTAEAVREQVRSSLRAPLSVANDHTPPFTPAANKVLRLALRQAIDLGHNYVGTEHILLGIVREPDGGAAAILRSLGAELPRVFEAVTELVPGARGSSAGVGSTPGPAPAPPVAGDIGAILAALTRLETSIAALAERVEALERRGADAA